MAEQRIARKHAPHRPQAGDEAREIGGRSPMKLAQLVSSIGRIPPQSVGPDGFPVLADDPLAPHHIAISDALRLASRLEEGASLLESEAVKGLLATRDAARGDLVCALLMRLAWICTQSSYGREPRQKAVLAMLERALGPKPAQYHRERLHESLCALGDLEHLHGQDFMWGSFLRTMEEHLGRVGLGSWELQGLAALKGGALMQSIPRLERDGYLLRIEKMLSGCQEMHVEVGTPWADLVHEDLEGMEQGVRAEWDALLAHLPTHATSPSSRWLEKSRGLMAALGEERVKSALLRWLPLFGRRATLDFAHGPSQDPASSIPGERNEELLRGMAFLSSLIGGETLSAVLADVALASYHKIPNRGPRSVRLGNACIWALGHMPQMACVGQLWRLRQRIGYASAERMIDQAIEEACGRFLLSSEDLEELSVPTFGLDRAGCMEQVVGDWRFELRLEPGREVVTRWVRQQVNGQGQLFALLEDQEVSLVTPRALIRQEYDACARIEASVKELEKMVDAQRERLEGFYWSGRSWEFELWQERYMEHPLLARLCEDLIWEIEDAHGARARYLPDRDTRGLVDLHGELHGAAHFRGARVRLWHPVGTSREEVAQWREQLSRSGVTQPFRQAHREVFTWQEIDQGGHRGVIELEPYVLKQHQLVALCKTRGWQAKLQGSWQQWVMPEKKISHEERGELTARLWVSAVSAPSLLTHGGAYIYVVFEQLGFLDGQERFVPLSEIEAVTLSELWREVELFVSVAGVSQAQADEVLLGALEQRGVHRLPSLEQSGASRMREEVLAVMLPRLGWEGECHLEQGVVWVERGSHRLGIEVMTGMVKTSAGRWVDTSSWRSEASGSVEIFLPFEGDTLLSTILWRVAMLRDHPELLSRLAS